MSKISNLKEWLTVTDAAKHLSIVFGEDVTEADIYHLALDGRLQLSVHFVNHTRACITQVVSWENTDWQLYPGPCSTQKESVNQNDERKTVPCPSKLAALYNEIPEDQRKNFYPMLHSLNIDDKRYLTLDKRITTLRGVWDLSMIGNEKLDIEHAYQALTGGPAVELQGLAGAFVQQNDCEIYQLQESFDNNPYMKGSSASLQRLKQRIDEKGIDKTEAESLLSQHKKEREAFLDRANSQPPEKNYFPAGGLPDDAVIVVRTKALRELEKNINGAPLPASRDHVSDKLAKLNQAAAKFWSNAKRDDRGTHEDNATVAAWLVKQGFSQTLADKAATIIRPEWAPVGRKPEE